MSFCCQIYLSVGVLTGSQRTRRWTGISFSMKEIHGMNAAVALEKDSGPTSSTGLVCRSEAGRLRRGGASEDWLCQ